MVILFKYIYFVNVFFLFYNQKFYQTEINNYSINLINTNSFIKVFKMFISTFTCFIYKFNNIF